MTTRDIKVSGCKSTRENTYLRATLSTRALHAPPPPQAPTKAHVTWHSRAALARPSELCYPRHTILVYRFFTELWHFAFNIVSTDRLKTKMCWLPSLYALMVATFFDLSYCSYLSILPVVSAFMLLYLCTGICVAWTSICATSSRSRTYLTSCQCSCDALLSPRAPSTRRCGPARMSYAIWCRYTTQ